MKSGGGGGGRSVMIYAVLVKLRGREVVGRVFFGGRALVWAQPTTQTQTQKPPPTPMPRLLPPPILPLHPPSFQAGAATAT